MSAAAVADASPVEAARALQATLRARADEIEQARRLPADLSERFAEAGFYRLCVPAAYGGLESAPAVTAETIETLARADGSAAWCVFIAATSGTALAALPPESARAVFAHERVLLSGVFAPRGVAEREGDAFRVNGEWAWGSGTQNADWVLCGCRLHEAGAPLVDAHGAPRQAMMLVPAAEVEFLDTWHVSGLCGTGSTDFAVRGALVPEACAVGVLARPLERPLYAFPQFGLLAMGIAAVSLGLARHAIDALIELANAKKPDGSGRTLAERTSTQSEVARAEASWRSARLFFYASLEGAWRTAQATGRLEVPERRDLRLATTHATHACAEIASAMYRLGGGSAVYRRSPLQRIFRDANVATQHMMVSPSTLELTGRLFLGLETETRFL